MAPRGWVLGAVFFWVGAKALAAPGTVREARGARREGRATLVVPQVAPSGVDALPLVDQALVFGATFAALGLSTVAGAAAIDAGKRTFGWFKAWSRTFFVLGAVYVAAGFAHFAVADAFLAIYPPQGTWGLWYLPGSAEFHVAWTGVAEAFGGAALLVGGAAGFFFPNQKAPLLSKVAPVAAAALFALTVAVTPANIYMYTHGATMPGAGPEGPLDLSFHYVRFAAQVVLLSILKSVVDDGPTNKGASPKKEP